MGFLTESDKNSAVMEISDQALYDLLADQYMEDLFDVQHAPLPLRWQRFLTQNPEDLVYRREVLTEFRSLPDIVQKVREVCQCIQEIQAVSQAQSASGQYYSDSIHDFKLYQHTHDALLALSASLSAAIENGQITSRGLKRLNEMTEKHLKEHFNEHFDEDWGKLTTGLDSIGSFTLRFALDEELHITDCAITAIRKEKYGRRLLPFTSREGRLPDKPWELAPVKDMRSPVEELLHDALRLMHSRFIQLMRSLTDDLGDLYLDLAFYLAALSYWQQLDELKIEPVFAEIRPMEEKAFTATDMVNPILLLHKKEAVRNSIDFAAGGEIFILTGMNQGGKTTFLRTVGMMQLLFQLGWPLPVSQASISPVEKLVTVFSHEENTALQHGKLGQELKAMRLGMTEMTPNSLMLYNEPITGTSPMENLYLSREILSVCKLCGYHGIWVTHIYDLASRCEAINARLDGSKISSLRVLVEGEGEDVHTSYRIERGEPSFTSYAKQVLERETGVF